MYKNRAKRGCCGCKRRIVEQGSSDKPEIIAVNNVSFGVDQGECFALLGVNGAGKTTCFKTLTNEIPRTAGDIRVKGYDVTRQFKKAAK